MLISPNEVLAIHIGDSAVVGRRGSKWDVICWPENGEYASTTYFVTDDPEPRLNIVRQNQSYNAFALFTDGVGDLALSHLEQKAHARFFDPMIRPVDSSMGAGRLHELSRKIEAYLAGPSVCERTDDAREMKKLKSTREARHRAAYLDQFSVRNANISGIGPVKTATLISFGIETAADVGRSAVLRVPGCGDVMTGRLMDWRRRHESRFRYNPTPNAQDTLEENALRAKFASQKKSSSSFYKGKGIGELTIPQYREAKQQKSRRRFEAIPNKASSLDFTLAANRYPCSGQ